MNECTNQIKTKKIYHYYLNLKLLFESFYRFYRLEQRETQQNDLIPLLQPHTCLTEITDITVCFETTHRRHRPHRSHRSHRSHITHKVSRKKAGFDQRNQSETYRHYSYTVSQYLTWKIHGRETRLVTNYND